MSSSARAEFQSPSDWPAPGAGRSQSTAARAIGAHFILRPVELRGIRSGWCMLPRAALAGSRYHLPAIGLGTTSGIRAGVLPDATRIGSGVTWRRFAMLRCMAGSRARRPGSPLHPSDPPSHAGGPPSRSARGPEAGQRLAVRALAQLLERAVPDLADPLPGDAEQRADLLQRTLLTVVQPVVEVEDPALPLGEVALEHPVQELPARLGLHLLLDVDGLVSGEPLPEGSAVPVPTIDGGVEGELGCGHPPQRTDRLDRLAHLLGDLLIRGRTAERLGPCGLRPGELDEIRVLVQRDADRASLFREGLENGLANPPDGVGDELDALVRVELLDRLEQTFIPDAYELGEAETATLILLHVGDDEAQVGGDQSFGGLPVARPGAAGKLAFLFGILDQRVLLYVVEVLIERVECTGVEKHGSRHPRMGWHEKAANRTLERVA